ncbi:MAG: 16S rRNA (cytidine(1402)-2'-O)-methyltransferase [Candidatus Bipolaricaulota bacterium]|nr:16S rRNA (cytidine(1402)-2'-O)-methyltransferase [Candidatus Bipolaricaulota bacterium]
MSGTLYLVSTPIGNLSDITLRAIATLRMVDRIIAEDTRNTRRILSRYRITTPFTASYYQGVERERIAPLLSLLNEGKDLALVSDAGTPLISDPGYPLIRAALEQSISVVPIPGATALIAALTASGLPTDHFVFDGALPRKQTEREAYLNSIASESRTVIVHSSPHRLFADLEAIASVLSKRTIVLARELTKVHEEFLRGSAREILNVLEARGDAKGECILLISGAKPSREQGDRKLGKELAGLLREEGISSKSALRILMQATNMKRNDAYRLLHNA